jgi:hypothetical protein
MALRRSRVCVLRVIKESLVSLDELGHGLGLVDSGHVQVEASSRHD